MFKFMYNKKWINILFWANFGFCVLNVVACFIFLSLDKPIKFTVLFAILNLIGMRSASKANELFDKIQKLENEIKERRK